MPSGLTCRELEGPGTLRYLVSADSGQVLATEVLACASRRAGRHSRTCATSARRRRCCCRPRSSTSSRRGAPSFRDLAYDQVHRLQFDLETTGLHADRDRIFLIAMRDPDGRTTTLEVEGEGDAAEADLIRRLVATIQAIDPDVIENHNLHGFDLPFLHRRAARLRVPLALGRTGLRGFASVRPSAAVVTTAAVRSGASVSSSPGAN